MRPLSQLEGHKRDKTKILIVISGVSRLFYSYDLYITSSSLEGPAWLPSGFGPTWKNKSPQNAIPVDADDCQNVSAGASALLVLLSTTLWLSFQTQSEGDDGNT